MPEGFSREAQRGCLCSVTQFSRDGQKRALHFRGALRAQRLVAAEERLLVGESPTRVGDLPAHDRQNRLGPRHLVRRNLKDVLRKHG